MKHGLYIRIYFQCRETENMKLPLKKNRVTRADNQAKINIIKLIDYH